MLATAMLTITVQDTTSSPSSLPIVADGRTASDNWASDIEVSSETTILAMRWQLHHLHCHRRCWKQTQTITVQDTTAPEFTFVPAETTVECSDEMPMDDATASDNCGR